MQGFFNYLALFENSALDKLLNKSPKRKKSAHVAKSLPAAIPPHLTEQPCIPVTEPVISFTTAMLIPQILETPIASLISGLPYPQVQGLCSLIFKPKCNK